MAARSCPFRFIIALAGVLLIISAAMAGASPPVDFTGNLFIDRSGCVLVRVDGRWQSRLLPDGSRDCGYPPTPVADNAPTGSRGTDLPLPPGIDEAEARLLATMAEGVVPGDLATDAHPPAGGTDHPLARELAGAVSPAGSVARMIVAGGRPNTRLCDMIGLDGEGVVPIGSGVDPSRGFCPGTGPDMLAAALRPGANRQAIIASRARDAQVLGAGETDPATDESTVDPGPAQSVAADAEPAARRPVVKAETDKDDPAVASAQTREAQHLDAGDGQRRHPDTVPRRPAVATATGKGRAEDLIPAGARYLQVSAITDPAQAIGEIARIAALGLPVARGRATGTAGILIMAGPFASREDIVRAHDRLRAAGFSSIIPR